MNHFLGATTHLYNWLCPLVGRLVGWSRIRSTIHTSHLIGLLGLVFFFFASVGLTSWTHAGVSGATGGALGAGRLTFIDSIEGRPLALRSVELGPTSTQVRANASPAVQTRIRTHFDRCIFFSWSKRISRTVQK